MTGQFKAGQILANGTVEIIEHLATRSTLSTVESGLANFDSQFETSFDNGHETQHYPMKSA